MRKLIFLDIDGVLNSHESFNEYHTRTGKPSNGSQFSPGAVANLNALLAAVPDAEVVISSSWRILHPLEELRALFASNGVTDRIIGVTPNLNTIRGVEIARWLYDNRLWLGVDVHIAIIDDDDADMGSLVPYLVQTKFAKGMQTEHISQAVELLTSGRKVAGCPEHMDSGKPFTMWVKSDKPPQVVAFKGFARDARTSDGT
jgi:hypothetical protein